MGHLFNVAQTLLSLESRVREWQSGRIDLHTSLRLNPSSAATDDALPPVLSHIWNSVIASRNLTLESYYSCSPLVIASCRSQVKMGKRLHSNFCPLADCNKDLNIHIQQRQLVCESQIDTWPEPHTDVFVWLLPLTRP